MATDLNLYYPWLGVFGAWICFGSFAVPMKWKSVVEAQVDPFVFQCYKTFWTFVTSHLVLLLTHRYEFTVWGILSGFSWVPAGVAAVVAVQHVGIAYGQATWQVTIILTSCVWGFGIFRDEPVHSVWGTAAALACLVFGVVGMTLSFNLRRVPDLGGTSNPLAAALASPSFDQPDRGLIHAQTCPGSLNDVVEGSRMDSDPDARTMPSTFAHLSSSSFRISGISAQRLRSRTSLSDLRFASDDVVSTAEASRWFDARRTTTQLSRAFAAPSLLHSTCRRERSMMTSEEPAGSKKTSATLGIAAALFNGTWGGSNLVPSKYAPLHGIHFVISFATGALIANLALVVVYAVWIKLVRGGSLPSPQFRVMALPGFLSGSMWSAGNFCSLYVVNQLGQGIGYSLVQSSVACSGLWGILWYKEMTGRPVLYWCLCCAVCLGGVVLLAFEKE